MKERCEFLFVRHHVAVGVRRSETSLVPPHHVTVVVLQVDWGVLCEQEPIRRLMSVFVSLISCVTETCSIKVNVVFDQLLLSLVCLMLVSY